MFRKCVRKGKNNVLWVGFFSCFDAKLSKHDRGRVGEEVEKLKGPHFCMLESDLSFDF